MNKSIIVHLKNKYPGGRVDSSDHHISAYDSNGNLMVALQKDGMGNMRDVSEEMGAEDKFCNGPIPKWARVHKLHADGRIGKSEEHLLRSKGVKGISRVASMSHDDAKMSKDASCQMYARAVAAETLMKEDPKLSRVQAEVKADLVLADLAAKAEESKSKSKA